MEALEQLLTKTLHPDILIKVVLSDLKIKSTLKKVELKPILIKGQPTFQLVKYIENKVFHQNLDATQASAELLSLLQDLFRQALIQTSEGDYQVFVNKDQSIKILKKEATLKKQPLEHNKQKNYLFQNGTPVPFLVEVGIMNKDGQVVKAKYDKFKQINRFVEFIDDVMDQMDCSKPIKIIDFGCGKSYLTFAIHHYLTKLRDVEVDIIGLDLKRDVIEECNEIARKCNLSGIRFEVGNIHDFEYHQDVDMVVSLHACNTATDMALAKAVSWNAKVILAVPCCHHELHDQIQSKNLPLMLEHGIIKERISALLTDVIRSSILELHDYQSQILEFIDLEHTPKNLLIRAIKVKENKNKDQVTLKLKQLKQEFGFHLTLEKLLKVEIE